MLVGNAENETEGGGGNVTLTTAESFIDPPGPVHLIVYVVVAAGVTVAEPLIAVELVHPAGLTAIHESAFVDDHVSVADVPKDIVCDEGVSATVGGGSAVIPTGNASLSVPPGPMQESVYVVGAVIGDAASVPPISAFVPDHPPDAVHIALAPFTTVHESVGEVPERTDEGPVSVTMGGAIVTVADAGIGPPPRPVQLIVYVVVPVGVTICEPDVVVKAVHPTGVTATHDVAFVEDQVSGVELPGEIVMDGPSVTVGGITVTVTVAVATADGAVDPVQMILYI